MKNFLSKTILAVAAICLLFCGPAQAQDDTIKVGAILAVTGGASFLGGPESRTIEMQVEKINANGGIHGKKIELILKDSGANPEKAISFAKQLIEEEKVFAIVGPSTSGETMKIKNICEQGKTVLLSCGAAEVIESNQDIRAKIKAKVRNGDLTVSFSDFLPLWLLKMPKLDIYINFKDLKMCRVAGVGKISCDEIIKVQEMHVVNSGVGSIFLKIETEKLITTLKGVGEIELSGKANFHDIEISGTGKVNAYSLEAEEANVRSTGVGECIVNASKKLNIYSSGIGKVRFKGNPEIKSKQSGLGGIEKIQ